VRHKFTGKSSVESDFLAVLADFHGRPTPSNIFFFSLMKPQECAPKHLGNTIPFQSQAPSRKSSTFELIVRPALREKIALKRLKRQKARAKECGEVDLGEIDSGETKDKDDNNDLLNARENWTPS
jgi:hypothetical protein